MLSRCVRAFAASSELSACSKHQISRSREVCACSKFGSLSALCGDPSKGMSTEWYATVAFQGVTTTYLGSDYMLRAEQVSYGTEKCSELQGQHMDQCYYPSDQIPASNSCHLCKSDDTLYGIILRNTVTIEQSTQSSTITCTAMHDAMAKLEKSVCCDYLIM